MPTDFADHEQNHNYLLKVLEKTRQKLLDTTRRNRLLNYRESGRDIAIVDEMADLVFEDLVLNGKSFYFDFLNDDPAEESDLFDNKEPDRALPETRNGGENVESRYRDDLLQTPFSERELEGRLRRLYQEHRTMIEETGANSLFIAMGFLEWADKEHESKPSRSPLLLVPVRLTREGTAGQARYSLTFDDGALDTNYSLVEKLKELDINLPQIEEEEKPEHYWEQVDHAISRRNADGWNVVHEMALGLFRFNKQVMWHDLNPDRWPEHAPLVDKKVLKRILLGPIDGEQEPGQIFDEYPQDGENVDSSAASIKLIRDADSSQFSALIDALSCDSGLVIEGPPGTGKSQTITNLIATALDQGLSVLFVAEKMAALDVVHKRLAENGLDPFCLQLHGLKTSKKELLESIAERINYRVEPADSLSQKERQLQQARTELIAYSKVMSECIGPEELPLYEIAWKIERLRQELPDEIEELKLDTGIDLNFGDFDSMRNQLNDLGKEWSEIPEDARITWAGFLPIDYVEKNESKFSSVLKSPIQVLNDLNNYLLSKDAQIGAPILFEAKRLLLISKTPADTLLTEIPFGVDSKIIKNVVSKNALDGFQFLLKDIRIYLDNVGTINQTFDYSSKSAKDYAKLLYTHSKLLAGVALTPSVAINSLAAEKTLLQEVIENLNSLDPDSAYVLNLLNKVARTIEDFDHLLSETNQLIDGPVELSLHANTHHAKSSIKNYLEQARKITKELEGRTNDMSQFVFTRIETSESVKEACTVIEENVGNFFAIFNGEYRKAKKLVKKILADSSKYEKSQLLVDSLGLLYELCTERGNFAANSDFGIALGSLFKGIDTEWKKLEAIIQFSQSLREKVGIDEASKILADWDTHLDTTIELKEKLEGSLAQIKRFEESHPYPDSMWQRPVNEIAGVLTPWVEKLQFATESLNQPWCRSTTTMKQAYEIAALFLKTRKQEQAIEALPSFSELLHDQWGKAATDIGNLEKTDLWITSTLSHPGMDISMLAWLFGEEIQLNKGKFSDLHQLAVTFSTSWSSLLSLLDRFGEVDEIRWIGGTAQSIAGLTEKLGGAEGTLSCLPLMKRWSQASRSVESKGCGAIARFVSAGILSNSQCGKAYEFYLYKSLLTQKVASDQILADFSHSHFQSTRDRFAKLDQEIMSINAKQIAARLAGFSVPSGVGSGPVGNYTQKRLLVHEANKQRRHIPIRQLVKRSGGAIKALKPCFLMSPLSVAQYLGPGDIHFDLVIMDEASQMRPEDALGAIARADTSIIVGDPKQLPPTSFFDTTVTSDEDNEDASVMDDTEAILDVCLKQFPYRRLRWHYRSEHESLIQFSNEQFYDGDLIIFPSPKPNSRDYGVHYNFIDNPSYSRGRNRGEAEVVVENIIHHYRRHSKKSLGVAAFNKVQAEEIGLLLDRARQQDPAVDSLIAEHDSEEPLFIKNLENVQGDERDVIFISTTYGPEKPNGPVAQRFGPINSEIGWRRLNVIATRAKQRVEVFTSMRPNDVGRGEKPRRGVRALRDYLEFASTGRVTEKGISTGKEPDSEFEVAVIRIISNLGYQCEPQVGVAGFYIDIGVINPDRPGEYLIGVECDGATYHSSRSVRDRDRLRQEILESKGWVIHRIWSTNWFQSRSTEIDRLKRVLQERLDEDRRTYEAVADLKETLEVVTEAPTATEFELEQEVQEEKELLEEALERFWHQNIGPLYPDRSRSILSEKMIRTLVNKRPTSPDEWFESLSTEMRQAIDPNEGEFRQDIFEIIAEYE